MKKFWVNLKLKMSLLKIWLLKNLLLFVEIAFFVFLILIFSGVINENTAFFGSVEPFKSLVKAISEATAGKYETAIAVLGSIGSVLVSILMFSIKAKSIAQADIKDDKLKFALIQANLYFNSDGKLVKKIEKATGKDLNRDGKVDDGSVPKIAHKNIFSRMVSAVKEFVLIITCDFSEEDSKTSEKYEEVLDNTEMQNAAEASEEIENILIEGGLDAAENYSDELADAAEKDESLTEEEKDERVTIFKRIARWFKEKRAERKEKSEEKKLAKAQKRAKIEMEDENIENNMEEDLNNIESSVAVNIEQSSPKQEEPKSAPVQNQVTEQPDVEEKKNATEAFLAGLRHR